MALVEGIARGAGLDMVTLGDCVPVFCDNGVGIGAPGRGGGFWTGDVQVVVEVLRSVQGAVPEFDHDRIRWRPGGLAIEGPRRPCRAPRKKNPVLRPCLVRKLTPAGGLFGRCLTGGDAEAEEVCRLA